MSWPQGGGGCCARRARAGSGAQASHPAAVKPELAAAGPSAVWSWDITNLHGPAKWTYYHLFCTNACGQSPVSSHCPSEFLVSKPPLFGYSCWQAVWAARSWELLTLNCCALPFGTPPPLGGRGKFGTPCERMQWE